MTSELSLNNEENIVFIVLLIVVAVFVIYMAYKYIVHKFANEDYEEQEEYEEEDDDEEGDYEKWLPVELAKMTENFAKQYTYETDSNQLFGTKYNYFLYDQKVEKNDPVTFLNGQDEVYVKITGDKNYRGKIFMENNETGMFLTLGDRKYEVVDSIFPNLVVKKYQKIFSFGKGKQQKYFPMKIFYLQNSETVSIKDFLSHSNRNSNLAAGGRGLSHNKITFEILREVILKTSKKRLQLSKNLHQVSRMEIDPKGLDIATHILQNYMMSKNYTHLSWTKLTDASIYFLDNLKYTV